MSTGGEEARKLSTGRPLSAEAVEFSPALAREQHRRQGRRTMPIRISGINLTQVAELPYPKWGGGGEVHSDGGGPQTTLNGRRGKNSSPTQRATNCWKHISRDIPRDVECSPRRHAF